MRARRLRASTLGAACLAAVAIAGCQTLVGIEGSSLATDTAGGATDGGVDVTTTATTTDAGAADGSAWTDADAAATDAPAALLDAACPDVGDAATDAPSDSDAAEPCVPLARRCNGNVLEQCSTASAWSVEATCDAFCRGSKCEAPPSCSGVSTSCGTSGDPRSCCGSHLVPGGAFVRDFDGVTAGHLDDTFKATVSGFLLDDFEVTVERFKRFVDAYPAASATPDGGAQGGSVPVVGSGKNANDPSDLGWEASFPLPKDRAALVASVSGGEGCDHPTWGAPADLPLACATYYVAYAFCIWDGGRLPTEAEWNFAASGGAAPDGQRVYPWSDPPGSQAITSSEAVYSPSAVAAVGAKLPLGQGKWRQADLAGNLAEWVRDAYASPYAKNPCLDCTDSTLGADRVIRGGDFTLQSTLLRVGERTSAPPEIGFNYIGFRCARSK